MHPSQSRFDGDSTELRSMAGADELFRLFIEQVADYAMFLLDPGGRVATWNTGAERIKGYRAEEIIGQHFARFYTEEDRRACKPDLELRVAARTGRFEDEGWRVRKDGSRFWANVVITALRNAAGALVGFAKITRDLTERRRAEDERVRLAREASGREALEHGFELLRAVIDNLPELAWTALPDGHIDFYNRRWFEFTGTTFDEMRGWGWEKVHHAEMLPKVLETWRRALATGEPMEMEYPLRGADGVFRWFLSRVRPLRDARGAIVRWIGMNVDVDARVRAEKERESARHELELANRAKDEFLATISHELRTPLNAILGWTVNLRRLSPPAPIERGLVVIERNAHAQARLIEDVLDMSRIISGKLRLVLSTVRLADAVRAALDSVRASADAKGIAIDVEIDETVELRADPDRIQQIVWNLVANAVKFTSKGGRVSVGARAEGAQVSIVVRDTGEGIPRDLLGTIFEPFRQVDSSTTRAHGGLGLGLAIVAQLVQAHGGTVHAESDGPGRGASFIVKLPARSGPADARVGGSAGEETPDGDALPRLDGIRVLVVDDEADSRDVIAATLEERGARVESVGSAAAALDRLRASRPDIVVSDIGMPCADGYQLVRWIRALPQAEGGRTPAIAVTAYARAEDARRAFAAGFQCHITKPVDPRSLVETIASLCGILGTGAPVM